MSSPARRCFIGFSAVLVLACGDDGKRPLGESCSSDGDCVSGFCAFNVCLDPAGDDDLDGIANGVEAGLGSDPLNRDSDFDGDPDGAEITSDQAGVDTDGDGALDVVESRTLDADGDCIPDQYDAQDTVPTTDLSPMRDVVCRTAGICAEQLAALGVACPGGFAVCQYGNVVGYSEPEAACDGRDENCDGRIDDGFGPDCKDSDQDDDGIADHVDDCPAAADPDQADVDRDGIGDACVGDYELVFQPAPPTALVAGARFAVGGVVVRKAGAPGGATARLPTFHGRVDLVTDPPGGVAGAVFPAHNVVRFAGLAFESTGTWRFVLRSSLGSTVSADVVVTAADAIALELSAPAQVEAGAPFTVSAIARDRFGNVADLDGAATLVASDAHAAIPPEGDFQSGTWSLDGVALATAGEVTLTLSTGSPTLTAEAVVEVVPGDAVALELALPPTAKAGVPVDATLTLRDAGGNLATGFAGTVTLVGDDTHSDLPASITLGPGDAGVRTFQVSFGDLGLRTVTATTGALTAEASTLVRAGAPHHLVLTSDDIGTTGRPLTVHVAVFDRFDHLADDPADLYTGTVSFQVAGAQPDLAPILPPPTTFTARDKSQRDVSSTWFRPGTWLLGATGTKLEVPTATVEVTIVSASSEVLELTAPARAKAGVPVDVTVTVRDASGNISTGFNGPVSLLDNDPRSELPTPIFVNAGTRTFAVTFGSPGIRTIHASAGVLKDTATLEVVAGAPVGLTLVAPSPAVVGAPQAVSVTIRDRYGNVANDPDAPFLGTVHFDVVGPQPSPSPLLPPPLVFSAANAGLAGAEIVWFVPGTWILAATGDDLENPTATAAVQVVVATGLEVTLPASVKSGVPVDVTVRALGLAGATATSFVGTVQLSDDDPHAVMPASIGFTAADVGVRTFKATFGDAGLRTVTARAGGISGRRSTKVLAGSPHTIRLTVTGVATNGVPKKVHVAVVDSLGHVADDPSDTYHGTVTFDVVGTQPEVAPTLPGPTTFSPADLSEKDLDTTWFRIGTFNLRASGTGLVSGIATAVVQVVSMPAASIQLTLPAISKAGVPVPLTITVRDAAGNVATGFVGTLRLADNDPRSNLPSTIRLDPTDAGARTLMVTFGIVGERTATATWEGVRGADTTTVVAGSPYRIFLGGGHTIGAGKVLQIAVIIVDTYGNAADDPADPYRGTVTFSATGPVPAPLEFLPNLPPTLPAAHVFTAGEGILVPTQWYRTGTWTFRAAGTGLVVDTTSHSVQVIAGPATLLDIVAPATMVAGSAQSALVRAVDEFRNTATTFDGIALVAGSDELVQDSIAIAAGVGTELLDLPLTIAGAYLITADSGALHGEAAIKVTAAVPYNLLVTVPDAVDLDEEFSAHLRVADEFMNTVKDFRGNVEVTTSTDAVDFVDAEPIVFIPANLGERDFRLSFSQPGFQWIDFDGSAAITPNGDANVTVAVLSGKVPSYLTISTPEDVLAVNVPYKKGFRVRLFDSGDLPTGASVNTLVAVTPGIALPAPTRLAGTAQRTIAQGESSVLFDDLAFARDGRFTLVAFPVTDGTIDDDESDPFDVRYRAPEVTIQTVTESDGCVAITYDVAQAAEQASAPVDVIVHYRIGESSSRHATQASSGSEIDGHFHLAPGDDHVYLWNAIHDLFDSGEYDVAITVTARSGSRYLDNPTGSDSLTEELFFAPDVRCQPQVRALLPTPPFPDHETLATSIALTSETLASADFDRDGKLDLVQTLGQLGLGVAFGRGDGGFDETPLELADTPDDDGIIAVVVGDYDGDGKPDLVAGHDVGGISVYAHDGGEGQEFAPLANLPSGAPARMAGGDMDGDGREDLVYVDVDNNITIAYRNTNPGEFDIVTEPTWEPGLIFPPFDVEVMNIDSRGALDLVWSRARAFLSDGGGSRLAYDICASLSSDSSGTGLRTYGDPICLSVADTDDDPELVAVDNLEPDPNPMDATRIFYRIQSGEGSSELSRVESRIWSGFGFDDPERHDECDVANRFTTGLFETRADNVADPSTDLAVSCNGRFSSFDQHSLAFALRDMLGAVDVERIDHVDLEDNGTLAAADFDGDGVDDVASTHGVLITMPSSSVDIDPDVRGPIWFEGGTAEEERAAVTADFGADNFPDLVTGAFQEDFEGNITLYLAADSPYPDLDNSSLRIQVCAFVCPPPEAWRLMLATGEIDGVDTRPELVVAAGSSTGGGLLTVLSLDSELNWSEVPLPGVALNGVTPATLAVGRLIDGAVRDDIAIGGHDDGGDSQLLVVHYNSVGGAFETYSQSGTAVLPGEFRESFIGDFDSDPAPELVLVDNGDGGTATFLAGSNCGVANASCVDTRRPAFAIYASSNSYTIDGVGAADTDGDGIRELMVNVRGSTEGGSWQEVTRIVWELDTPMAEVLYLRGYDVYPCEDDETLDCLERAVGPLTGDLDNDGTEDVLFGLAAGRTWQAITEAAGPYLFGGTFRERASLAVLSDIDDNGLLDVLVIEPGFDDDVWILGQEIFPPDPPTF